MFYFQSNIKIISGGQTGVDRAALDFALENKIPCSGWCPKGRIAEDGKISEKYPLNETPSSDYHERTKKNIEMCDATLIIHAGNIDKGTKLTADLCSKLNKPMYSVNLENILTIPKLMNWLQNNKIKNLNIAGPRESNSPGIYNASLQFLKLLLKI